MVQVARFGALVALALGILFTFASSAAAAPDPGYPFRSVAEYAYDVELRASSDVNGDGEVDLVGLRRQPGAPTYKSVHGAVVILLGDGTGFFAPPLDASDPVDDVEVADVNADGTSDLVTSTKADPGTDIEVLLGSGDGSFVRSDAAQLGEDFSTALAVGDTDGDGAVDVTVLGASRIGSLRGDGAGGLAPAVLTEIDLPPTFEGSLPTRTAYESGMAVADFDGDGRAEVLFGVVRQPNIDEEGPFVEMSQRPDGTFSQRTLTAGADGDNFFVPADLNGDDRVDLVTTARLSEVTHSRTRIWLRTAEGDFDSVPAIIGRAGPVQPAVADFNHDGATDVAVVGTEYGEGTFAAGQGDGSFAPIADENRYPGEERAPNAQTGLVSADFNDDGYADLARSETSRLLIQRNELGAGPLPSDPGLLRVDAPPLRLHVASVRLARSADALARRGGAVRGGCNAATCDVSAKLTLRGVAARRPGLGGAVLRGRTRWSDSVSRLRLRAPNRKTRRALRRYAGPGLRATLTLKARATEDRTASRRIRLSRPIRAIGR